MNFVQNRRSQANWKPVRLTEKQEDAVRAIYQDPTTYFVAAWGVGKSIAVAYAAWKMLNRWAPGVDGCFIAPTMGQLFRTLVKAWEMVADPRFYRVVKSGPEPRIEWYGGKPSTIHLFTADAPERMEGPSYGWAAMEEMQDIHRDVMLRLEGRMRDATVKEPKIFGAGLPETGTWLHQDLVVSPKEEVTWIQGKTADNPHLHPKYIPNLKKRLPKNLYLSRVEGVFANPEGLVYPVFDRNIHVKPCPFTPKKRVIVGIDFNKVPYIPAVLYQEHDGETWGIDEILLKDSDTVRLAEALKKWCKEKKIDHTDSSQVVLVPDATGTARSPNDSSSCHITLQKAGFSLDCPAANPHVSSRDNAVMARLMTADDTAHLFFDPVRCAQTIAGFEALKHEKRKPNYYNHIIDAAGYPIVRYHPVWEGSYDEWAEALEGMVGQTPAPQDGGWSSL